MPHYNFEDDLAVAVHTEHDIARLLAKRYSASNWEVCKDNKYDIKMRVGNLYFYFEIKEDFSCKRTGNVGVEYESWGRKSGISTSIAHYYIYKIHTPAGVKVYLYKTSVLKKMIKCKLYHRIVNGGDEGSNSMNYLFTYDTFTKYGKQIAGNKEIPEWY